MENETLLSDNFTTPIERALIAEVDRVRNEGFTESALCLEAALMFVRRSKEVEFNTWLQEQSKGL